MFFALLLFECHFLEQEEFLRAAAVEVALTLPTPSSSSNESLLQNSLHNNDNHDLRPELLEVGVQELQNQLLNAGKKLTDFRNAASRIRDSRGERAYSKLVQNRCGGEKILERVLYDEEWSGSDDALFQSLRRHAGGGPRLLRCIDAVQSW